MAVKYLRVIEGIITGFDVSPLRPHESDALSPRRTKETVATFRAEDWRGMSDELHEQTLVLHLWTYGYWQTRGYQLRVKPPGIMCVDVEERSAFYNERDGEHLLLYGRPDGSFQNALARFLGFVQYFLKQRGDEAWSERSYEYSLEIGYVYKRPVEVQRHDGRTAVERANEHIEGEVQKWLQGEEAEELRRQEREAKEA